jgi:hypothetical protein
LKQFGKVEAEVLENLWRMEWLRLVNSGQDLSGILMFSPGDSSNDSFFFLLVDPHHGQSIGLVPSFK